MKIVPVIFGIVMSLFFMFGCSSATLAQDVSMTAVVQEKPEEAMLHKLSAAFDTLKFRSIRPAEGYLKYDYLIPAGFYKQMWDWDGFFIGCYLASHKKDDAKYLKGWVMNFVNSTDAKGYVPGCITIKGPRPIFGKFAMKPFLSQGAYFASVYGGSFTWITPVYEKLKKVIEYREQTQFDSKYGLFFWDIAIQSGADNNPALTNDSNDRSAILAADINTFQLREYISVMKIAQKLGKPDDVKKYRAKADTLKAHMLKYLWFKEDMSFFNIRRDSGTVIKRVTYSNFVPLIQDILTKEQAGEMIKKYLLNPEHMKAEFGFRSLSLSDPSYNNDCIIIPYSNWQGPIWINANFLYTIGLVKYGFQEQAAEAARQIAPILLKDIKANGSMHECYHADTGAPLTPTAEQSPKGIFTGFVGWNMLEQNMLEGAAGGRWMLLDLSY
ncbi:MAG: trehalase family glycosidase [Bacteroidetes bacterium]|nr:trehalase family glycosidase [Bacteroidota bacterium]